MTQENVTPSKADPWITVGELETAFSGESNRLTPTTALVGRQWKLAFEDESTMEYRFDGPEDLSFVVHEPRRAARSGSARYFATEIRPGIIWIDYLDPTARATSVSLVVDTSTQACTQVLGQLPTREDALVPLLERVAQKQPLTAVKARCLAGTLAGSWTDQLPAHLPSKDLIGRRIEYRYSPTERYEHVYLNEHFYSWHCLEGAERGLADTDQCLYRRVSDQLYLFSWQEKVIPTLGVVLVDLQQRRTSGKIFGYEGDKFDSLSNFPVGARMERIVESGGAAPGTLP